MTQEKARKAGSIICAVIALILAGVFIFVAIFSNFFTNWDKFKKLFGVKDEVEEEEEQAQVVVNGKEIVDENAVEKLNAEENTISFAYLKQAKTTTAKASNIMTAKADEVTEKSVQVTATTKPSLPSTESLVWGVEWADKTNERLSHQASQDVNDYITITTASSTEKYCQNDVATITCKGVFLVQIILTVKLESNNGVQTTSTIDYLSTLEGFTVSSRWKDGKDVTDYNSSTLSQESIECKGFNGYVNLAGAYKMTASDKAELSDYDPFDYNVTKDKVGINNLLKYTFNSIGGYYVWGQARELSITPKYTEYSGTIEPSLTLGETYYNFSSETYLQQQVTDGVTSDICVNSYKDEYSKKSPNEVYYITLLKKFDISDLSDKQLFKYMNALQNVEGSGGNTIAKNAVDNGRGYLANEIDNAHTLKIFTAVKNVQGRVGALRISFSRTYGGLTKTQSVRAEFVIDGYEDLYNQYFAATTSLSLSDNSTVFE